MNDALTRKTVILSAAKDLAANDERPLTYLVRCFAPLGMTRANVLKDDREWNA